MLIHALANMLVGSDSSLMLEILEKALVEKANWLMFRIYHPTMQKSSLWALTCKVSSLSLMTDKFREVCMDCGTSCKSWQNGKFSLQTCIDNDANNLTKLLLQLYDGSLPAARKM